MDAAGFPRGTKRDNGPMHNKGRRRVKSPRGPPNKPHENDRNNNVPCDENDAKHHHPRAELFPPPGCKKDCVKPAGLEKIYERNGKISEQFPPATIKDKDCKKYRREEELEIPGKPVCIIVNHFPVIFEEKPTLIYQYEVKLQPSCRSKALIRRLKYVIQQNYFNGELIGYDDGKNIFIAESTLQKKKEYLEREEIQFDIVPWEGATTYRLNLKRVDVLSLFDFKQYLNGWLPTYPPCYLHALQAALRDGPSSLPFSLNKTFYISDDQGDLKGRTHDCSIKLGLVQSLRVVELGPTLNLDSAAMAFRERKCVTHYFEGRGIARSMLVDLYVDIMDFPTYSKYRIAGTISKYSDWESSEYDKAKTIDAVPYFRRNRKPEGETNSPCLIVRGQPENLKSDFAFLIEGSAQTNSDDAPQYDNVLLPMEACVVAMGQKSGDDCRDRSVSEKLTKMAGGDAEGRYQTIHKNFTFLRQLFREGRKFGEQVFPSIKPFGINIGDEMISVVGRLIPEPKLAAKTVAANEPEANGTEANKGKKQPTRGEWKLKNVFKSGRSLDAQEWDVFVFGDSADHYVKTMMREILITCSKMSINCFGNDDGQGRDYDLRIQTSDCESPDKLETALTTLIQKHTKQQEHSNRLAKIRFVFCIFHQNLRRPVYNAVKRVCEKERGWMTQCCVMERLNFETNTMKTRGTRKDLDGEAPHASIYYRKVALKVNAKLGGVNNALDENRFLKSLFGSKNPVILFGANVTHVGKKNQENHKINDISRAEGQSSDAEESGGPVLLTMVASMEWPIPGQYSARVSLLKPKAKKVDIAHRLSAMAKELLSAHIKKNQGEIPTRAIFFREGVSESEFQSLVDTEFLHLKHALQSVCLGIKCSFIVAHRNQNTRFFIKNIKEGKEVIGNAEAGTVVDRDITGLKVPPLLAEFYLLSQSTQQKSLERPTHYFLLEDENDLNADRERLEKLEKFLFYLCYTHATSTTSVAIVPPLLYAHEAGSRAGSSHVEGLAGADIKPHATLINTMYFF